MSPTRLPSLDVSGDQKRQFTEADVHSKLFEPDMNALGYPARTATQADGEYFQEQRLLAMRRLRTHRERGHYDGLYLIGNSPIVLCELKRFDALDSEREFLGAVKQLQTYARSEDFETPPPFLLLYSGKPERTRFYRRRVMADGSLLDDIEYEELPEIWSWARVKDAHVRGAFAEEVVTRQRLLEILLHHLDRIEDDLRAPVAHAVQVVSSDEPPELLTDFGRWLRDHPEAFRRTRQLFERKVAETGRADERQVVEEMVTQAALNYLNKVFFLNLCEDRHLAGFYRILREFLPATRTETSPTTAAVFLGLLRQKIRDTAQVWDPEEERAYRALRGELTSEIREHVIEQNNWRDLVRVAFDLAEERFPLVYREDAFDYFKPTKDTLAELVFDLSTKSFRALTNRHVGDIYQGLLSSRRHGAEKGGRRRQQAKLGAFYTPHGDVEFMVSRLNLRRDSRVLDPCMGSGHFLEGIYEALEKVYLDEGFERADAYREIVGKQLYGGDIDTFATSLAAIRLFLLDEESTRVQPNLVVHDMLLHSPERPGTELFSADVLANTGKTAKGAQVAATVDPSVDEFADIDGVEFDAIVGNPPYGARKPAYKEKVYRRLYGRRKADIEAGSIGTGDGDTYGMFIANGIERLREGGRLCLICSDSFRSLTTHAALRRYVLDHCKIIEILLTDTKHFEGVSFQFAGMAITTLEKCSDQDARAANEMRLVDYVRNPEDFAKPSPAKVSSLRQDEYENLFETPFFVGVPRDVFESAKNSLRVSDVASGKVGVQTGEDRHFLAGIETTHAGIDRVITASQLARSVSADEQAAGIPTTEPHWVPFAKGEGYGEYWSPPSIAIDWSEESVKVLVKRSKAGSAKRSYLRNRVHYFRAGLTYSVISSGRISARLMPAGWIFGHKGSAIFVEEEAVDERFLLGYLNSAVATYFMKKLVNTTATADIGYIEKLPFRKPSPEVEEVVAREVDAIVTALQADPDADIAEHRAAIDDAVFALFDISSRDAVIDFYETVGRAEQEPAKDTAESVQAATE